MATDRRPRISLELKIGLGFGAALAILIAVGWLSYSSDRSTIARANVVAHTLEVVDKTEELRARMADAETGVRGYTLTGDTAFLAPYQVSRQAVPIVLATIARLTAESPRQRTRVDSLRALVRDKLEWLRHVIDVRSRSGLTSAAKLVATRRGFATMEQIRAVTDQMIEDESSLLTRHEATLQAAARRSQVADVLGILLGILTLAGAAGLIAGDLRDRRRATIQRETLINQLEAAVANIKTLSGLLPICSSCKKIRDDRGYWEEVEVYVRQHTEAEFSHGICPDCGRRLYGDLYESAVQPRPDEGTPGPL
jgi:CHASE3 domain sensor protein